MTETTPINSGVVDGDSSLPCDVQVAHITFRKGVKLSTFVIAAQRWHALAAVAPTPPARIEAEDLARIIYAAMQRADDDEGWPTFESNLAAQARVGGGNIYFNEAQKAAVEILSRLPIPTGGGDEPVAWLYEEWVAGEHWSDEKLTRKPPNHGTTRNVQPLALQSDLDAARERIRELEAALEPIFAMANALANEGSPGYREWFAEAKDHCVAFSFAGLPITLGDLRRFAALLPADGDLSRHEQAGTTGREI